jgi:anti-sigma factor RsiW
MTDHRHPAGPDLMAWRDDELPPPAAQAIADHVAACAACRAEVQALDQARGLLAGDPAPPLAPAWPRIAASRARDDRLGRPFAWAAAAACAAGLAAGLLVGSPAPPTGDADAESWRTDLPLWPGSSSESMLEMFSTGDADRRDDEA